VLHRLAVRLQVALVADRVACDPGRVRLLGLGRLRPTQHPIEELRDALRAGLDDRRVLLDFLETALERLFRLRDRRHAARELVLAKGALLKLLELGLGEGCTVLFLEKDGVLGLLSLASVAGLASGQVRLVAAPLLARVARLRRLPGVGLRLRLPLGSGGRLASGLRRARGIAVPLVGQLLQPLGQGDARAEVAGHATLERRPGRGPIHGRNTCLLHHDFSKYASLPEAQAPKRKRQDGASIKPLPVGRRSPEVASHRGAQALGLEASRRLATTSASARVAHPGLFLA
jgi:hypothetical protein